ncbi:threonine aldolase family protein [Sunxiuqinia elliptica]|uniref:L-threonine aldolase n=1 Tax=Sunxiuqinia elliptica TaxID=655355 RepID=A0A4R6GPU7_9BACT|nr:low specificity L-threonine aldolase [Sunxiuqinia elliptica]TDN97186.1 L-threonine aldolase [Sunxiuqinia elliptica]TDO60630.1 L-threonine aldolase [Sunxiuqinia elliptica]
MTRGFASDNNAGVHPNILKAIEQANRGHVVGYGDDPYTQEAIALFKKEFGQDTEVFFVFNGTGANVLALSSATNSFNSIICADTAHIQVDECGAPEKLTGCKLLPVPSQKGKITPEGIKQYLHGFDFEHHSQPRVISISQVTELGTVYAVEEIKAITALAHEHGLLVHMDGARLANAAVALNLPFRNFTRDAGVDMLSFGGTKNGLLMGEAVLFFNPDLTKYTKYIRKQNMQLFSKMRFVGAQFLAYFEDELWKTNAQHANQMAKLLEREILKLGKVQLTQETEANGVFAIVPTKIIPKLQEEYFFYVWDESRSEVRWMTSFDTTEEDIHGFVKLIDRLI